MIDDVVGFSIDDAKIVSNNVNERLTVNTKPSPIIPFSHGTHVATTALRDLDDYALIAVAGNMSDVDLINMSSALMLKEGVLFSNMSFSFGNRKSDIAPDSKSFRALQALIMDNDKALIAVAAGNDGVNLDYNYASVQYPASYKNKNLLVVGALNTGLFEEAKAPTYMMADFSNKGLKSVDIFAPGESMLAENVGNDFIAVSGTSMASPFALNIILKMSKLAPLLTTDELKQAVMYSAYIPNIDEPFDCVSGGMLFERRGLKVVDVMRLQGLKAKDAALLVRGMGDYILGAESTEEDYLSKVEDFWSSRMQFD